MVNSSVVEKNTTIAAIATPYGNSGIGIIKISGDKAFSICDRIFLCKKGFDNLPKNSITYGVIINPETEERIDSVLVSKMCRPNTYTGEDVAEINCHGGTVVLKMVLELVFKMGAVPAGPGEFTKRAFENGKIDLIQAEATMSLINAKAENAARIAVAQLSGGLSSVINDVENIITGVMAEMDVSTDFDDLDMNDYDGKKAACALRKALSVLYGLRDSFERSKFASEGLRVVICGKPNAGKSSLLNRLAGRERAIVTDIPGTTRDTIEEFISIKGYPVRLIDTAGIHDARDEVEKIGIERAKREMSGAQMIIYMIDASDSEGTDKQTDDIFAWNNGIGTGLLAKIVAINKADTVSDEVIEKCRKKLLEQFTYDEIIVTSVLQDKNTDVIENKIAEICHSEDDELSGSILVSARHKALTDKAIENLEKAVEDGENNMPLDVMYVYVRACAMNIMEMTGKSIDDEVLDKIFSEFCVGK